MRFEKTPRQSRTLVTTKGHHINPETGKVSHHPRGSYSTNKKKRPPTKIEFVGVDGEGMMVNGVHRYVLFGVGSRQIENPEGLQWRDVFEMLYSDFLSRGARDTCYVGFFLGYDFTQIFSTLPEERARMLLTREGRTARAHTRKHMAPHPVEFEGWQFDMLGMKRLRLRPKTCDCPIASCKCEDKASWMYVCDAGSFFQSSFLKVIDPKGWPEGEAIVTPEEWALVKAGKEKRAVAELDDDMRLYNRLENEILARVMDKLHEGFTDIGVRLPPSKWFGPGQAAQTWLRNINVPNREDSAPHIPLRFFEAARASYFGGWFEIMMHGIVEGETHEYDINSAYPTIIAKLPCLLHGDYSHGEGLPPDKPGAFTLVYGTVRSPNQPYSWKWKEQYIGAMLHRDRKGNISRPMVTEGWFWWHELQAARRARLVGKLDNSSDGQRIQKWVQYMPCPCSPPMADIAALYDKRLHVGKNTPRGKAAKLVYNSAYGKFAQSEGMNPVYGNPIYASLITAGCRTQILDAIASHPEGKRAVSMVATDAVYFLSPHPGLQCSEKLGEWDYKVKKNLTLFKPGVYWDDETRRRIADKENPNFKARGFKASDFVAALGRVDKEFMAWNDIPTEALDEANKRRHTLFGISVKNAVSWPTVQFTPSFSMVTAVQALQRNKWELAGAVQDASEAKDLKQSSDPSTKRFRLVRDHYDGRQVYRSMPHTHTHEPSVPYDKHFGMEDPFSEEYRSQFGEVQAGRIMDVLTWILNGD